MLKCLRVFSFIFLVVIELHKVTLAQTVISGTIYNSNKQVMSEVSVVLKKMADSTVVAYNFSNIDGSYKIIYSGNEKSLILSVSGFNIKIQEKKIDNHSQVVDFIIEESLIELKEITIKASKTWGNRDTVNYSVPAFSDKTDIVIGDVLKKMPGIEVGESGQIKYKGKPISKFYIENMDMLQGRYGIATNNISVNDIATVQVFENHQPIKALQDTKFSSDAAINLKIKEGAKGIYSIMAELGLGYDKETLWQNSLTGMYFSKKHQHICTYKGNNSGEDIFKELQSYTFDNPLGNNQLTYLMSPIPPDISKNKYYHNNSNAASLNNINRFKNESELSYNLIYLNDFETRSSFSKTSFLLPETGYTNLSENLSSTTNINHSEFELNYKRNDSNNYLNAYVNISANWEKANGKVINATQIDQTLLNNTFSVSNSIYWIRRNENKDRKGFELNSSNFYKSQPQQLELAPGLYPEIFNDANTFSSLRQNVFFNSFISKNFISLLSAFVWGELHINPTANFTVENQSLESYISKNIDNSIEIRIPDSDMHNLQNWTRVNPGVALNFTYSLNDLKINASLPINYQMIYLKDEVHALDIQEGKFHLQPSVSFVYNISSHFDLTGSYIFFNQTPDLRTLYSGYILQNYRSFNLFENRLSDSQLNGGSLKFSYKNIMEMFFAGVDLSRSHYKSDIIYGQYFDGILMKTTLVEIPNTAENVSLKTRLSKGFNWKALLISLEGSWGKGRTPQLRQDTLIQYTNQGLNINDNVYLKITPKLYFNNKNSWSIIKGRVSTGETLSAMKLFVNTSYIDIVMPFGIMFNTACEYYYNIIDNNSNNFTLLDLGINYTWKHLRISADWKNILNTKTYLSAYYSNMNSYYSEYGIRPASLMIKVQFKVK